MIQPMTKAEHLRLLQFTHRFGSDANQLFLFMPVEVINQLMNMPELTHDEIAAAAKTLDQIRATG